MTDHSTKPEHEIVFIVAADQNWGIGCGGQLPWNLPDDLKFFKRRTAAKPVIMGRRTHESIGRSLPGRYNIVVTHQSDYQPYKGSEVANSIDEAIEKADYAIKQLGYHGEIMVIGGAEVFNQMIEHASRVLLTAVDGDFNVDAIMYPIDDKAWSEESREFFAKDKRNSHSFSLVELRRRPNTKHCAA